MNKKPLVDKMSEYIQVKEKGLIERQINVQSMSFADLRDTIIGIGKILEENFEISTYVVNVPAGVANKNSAVVALQLSDSCVSMLGYAQEGLINQHTAEKAIDRVVDRISKYAKS
ncbi:MAG: hypothetical protein HDQ96_06490 [Lachnospiraceae bacterium]|nr:hypothetical protein [Lachnospiraceae bacterium]